MKRKRTKISNSQIVHPEDIEGWGEEKIEAYIKTNLSPSILEQLKEKLMLTKKQLNNRKVKYELSITILEVVNDR